MTKYNFEYSNSSTIGSEEYKIIQKLSKELIYQTALVNELFVKDVTGFTWDNVSNLYYKACECEDQDSCEYEETEATEIHFWIAYGDDSEHTRNKLDKAGIPYLYNDLGLWIGRTDLGSSQDIYFLPSLANALFNI